jgi:hypothetical protein
MTLLITEIDRVYGNHMGMEVIKSPENRKRLFCAVSVAPLAMLTGSNIITYVHPSIS